MVAPRSTGSNLIAATHATTLKMGRERMAWSLQCSSSYSRKQPEETYPVHARLVLIGLKSRKWVRELLWKATLGTSKLWQKGDASILSRLDMRAVQGSGCNVAAPGDAEQRTWRLGPPSLQASVMKHMAVLFNFAHV